MTAEERNIKNKIDKLSDIDVFFNDSNLWDRVENRLDQKKTRKNRFAWYWFAASVMVGLSFYFFLSTTNNPPLTHSVTKNTATSILQPKTKTIAQSMPDALKTHVIKKNSVEPIIVKDSVQNNEMQKRLILPELRQLNSIDKPLVAEHSKDIFQHPIEFKAQRVTTLLLPVIPDEMMERESFAKRALRQIRNFNTEGRIDLRELNIEPRNVWAYLERSFFHDTTKITKLQPLK